MSEQFTPEFFLSLLFMILMFAILTDPFSSRNSGEENCGAFMARSVQEVLREKKTGRWIEYPEALGYKDAYLREHIVCSACEHVFCTLDNCTEEFNFCPHCGADMREGR